uniref:Uncharacterized protein n=1 Tax=Arundo donax TaxID=35708 RepID=A0A0A9GA28_ARUDO
MHPFSNIHNIKQNLQVPEEIVNRKFLTSQVPIFRTFAGKFEAFSCSPAVRAGD